MCWDDSEVQWAGDGLPNAGEAEKRRRTTWWNGRRGTEVPDHEDSGTSWQPSLAHPANEAKRGGVTPGHDQTSVCHWPHGRQHWVLSNYQEYKLHFHTRKPCCRKETARCRKCFFQLKFANNIHYKYKTSQASKAATLQSSKHADA